MLRYLCSALAVLLLVCSLEVRICAQMEKIPEAPAHKIADMKPNTLQPPGEIRRKLNLEGRPPEVVRSPSNPLREKKGLDPHGVSGSKTIQQSGEIRRKLDLEGKPLVVPSSRNPGEEKKGLATHGSFSTSPRQPPAAPTSKPLPGLLDHAQTSERSILDPLYGKPEKAMESGESNPLHFHSEPGEPEQEEHKDTDPDPPCNKYTGTAREQCEEREHNVPLMKPGRSLTICCSPWVVPQNPKSK